MARIRINLPEKYTFSTEIPIRSRDINRGGHLGWDSMFSILDETRVRFWSSIGYSETENEVVSNIMADAAIQYRNQAYHGQILKVEMAATEFSDLGFDLVYRVTETQSGKEIARAKTGMLCFNYTDQKIIPVPEDFRKRLSGE